MPPTPKHVQAKRDTREVDPELKAASSVSTELGCGDKLREKSIFVKVLASTKQSTLEDLRKLLLAQLVFFTSLNTMFAGFKLVKHNHHNIPERNMILVSVALVWSLVPLAFWAMKTQNRGLLALYAIFGVWVGCGRVAYIVASICLTAASCQFEQISFGGCSGTPLTCLEYSTCTSGDIDAYNQYATVPCLAWGSDQCANVPETQTTMGFGFFRIVMLLVDIVTGYMPLYVACLLLCRIEAFDVNTLLMYNYRAPADEVVDLIMNARQSIFGSELRFSGVFDRWSKRSNSFAASTTHGPSSFSRHLPPKDQSFLSDGVGANSQSREWRS
ncbi:hypothetical protein DIPPA_02514 [Diplonema papillatum]|nr:hypothetical protein DIPPA_02514 [Diplonema papillatum]